MNELTKVSNSCAISWSVEQKDLIKNQLCPGMSDLELDYYYEVCKRTGLDPFIKQIHAIMRKQKNYKTNKEEYKMTIQTSVDGLRRIADRTGKYDGSESFWCGRDGVWHDVWTKDEPVYAAKTVLYKRGCEHPFIAVANFKSYAVKRYDGKLNSMWSKMPEGMIAKCSESLALRKAFPADMSGLYTKEEMGQADNDTVYEHENNKVKNKIRSTSYDYNIEDKVQNTVMLDSRKQELIDMYVDKIAEVKTKQELEAVRIEIQNDKNLSAEEKQPLRIVYNNKEKSV